MLFCYCGGIPVGCGGGLVVVVAAVVVALVVAVFVCWSFVL